MPVYRHLRDWFGSADSIQYGSTFTYTQIFTISGDAANVGSVEVTLTNSVGSPLAIGPVIFLPLLRYWNLVMRNERNAEVSFTALELGMLVVNGQVNCPAWSYEAPVPEGSSDY